MKKTTVAALILSLTISYMQPVGAAAKAGAACTKLNATSISGSLKYTCVKVGKKLQWNKGVPSTNPSIPVAPVVPNAPAPVAPVQNISLIKSNPISDCKVADQRIIKTQPNNVGFPYSADLLPNSGNIKTVFIAIDFADAPGITDPSIDSESTLNKMNDWFKAFSGGKLSMTAQHSHQWFHSTRKSADIQNLHPGIGGASTAVLADALAQEWINATGSTFDFSGVTAIFFDFPNTIKGMGEGTQGRQGPQGKGVILQTKQGPITTFYNTTGEYWFKDDGGATAAQKQERKWSYYIHEMLHSMGIALHAPGNGFPLGLSTQQTGTPEGFSGTLDAWEMFLLGWLNDSQVLCTKKSDLTNGSVVLTARDEIKAGTKVAFIKLSGSKILAVESRRPVGWFNALPDRISGITVYIIDTSLDNDRSHESTGDVGNQPEYTKWAYYLLPDGVSGGYAIHRGINEYVLRKGQTVTYDGVKINYVQDGATDTIELSK